MTVTFSTRMLLALSLANTAFLAGCSTGIDKQQITIMTTTPNKMGGEAAFIGRLIIQNGCLVAITGKKVAIPIFDPGVTLQPDRLAINDQRRSRHIRIGQSFRAGTAWMRDGGTGWSVSDIEKFFSVRVPSNCPTASIIRLHDFDRQPT
jgi:hypothetical protein